MHIVHLYDGHEQIYEGRGSLPRIVWNVASRTAARGHDVTVIERKWDGLNDRDTHEGVEFRRLDLRTGADEPYERIPHEMMDDPVEVLRFGVDRLNFSLASLRMLRTLEFDALHVWLPFSANILVTLVPGLRKRMVYTAQLGELRLNALSDDDGQDVDAPEVLSQFSPDVYLAKRVARTTVLNENVKRVFAANGVPEEKLANIPNGVSIEKFRGVSQAEKDAVSEKFGFDREYHVLFVGQMVPRKGVVPIVEALAEVVSEYGVEDVDLVLVGEAIDEEYVAEVRSLISERGLDENVTFTGYADDEDLIPLYASSDVFVLPSFEEGFGMVVSEAMATGTPAVASDINGVRQQIRDGETGYLVQPGDASELAGAIAELLRDGERRRSFGEASREYSQQFSWEQVCGQYLDEYRRITR